MNTSSGFLFRVKVRNTLTPLNIGSKNADIMSRYHSLCVSRGMHSLLWVPRVGGED